MTILIFLKFLGSLGLLIYGMKLLGESLQKMAGNQLRHIMDTLTTNRFTSFLTGAIITAIIQSSSATSVMTIGFVHAGILTFIQGLSMIMGASVGNTFVAWIMAAEFNYAISYYIFPLFFVALWLVKLRDYRSLGESIFGLCFMFLGLRLLYEFTDDLQLTSSPVLSAIFGSLSDNYGSYLILLLCGGVFTLCFQSSAALMAASMILCSTGIISIYSGIALVLGENIGRGLITYYAASSANLTARRTAMAQLIFNLFGVLWVFWIFPYFIETVCNTMGYQTTGRLEEHALTYVLAAFHTCFNLCNVALFIWFIKPIERLVNNIVPKNDEENEDTNELRYITGGLLATPELSVLEAQKEINGFAEMTCRMFTQVRYLITINNTVEFRQIYMKIRNSLAKDNTLHYYKFCQVDEDVLLTPNMAYESNLFILTYMVTFFITVIIFTLFGINFEQASFEAASTLGTVGLSSGMFTVNSPSFLLIFASIVMVLGRLEIYVVFYGFIYAFKKPYRIISDHIDMKRKR